MERPRRDPVGIDEYRELTGHMSTGLCVLTCAKGSHTAAITMDSYFSVSWDPPTMAASVYSGSRMMEALESAELCTFSILSREQKETAQWLGTPGQPIYGLLSQTPTQTTELAEVYIDDCLTYFTISIEKRLEIVTHTLVYGPVIDAGEPNPHGSPLLRYHREYGSFSDGA